LYARASRAFANEPSDAVKRIYNATVNTLHGLAAGIRSEAAMREEAIALALALPVGVFVAPSVGWYVAMIGALLVLLAVELLNTAIEKLADHVTPQQHPQIGLIKDFGSAAVFCAMCLSGLVWLAALALRVGWL
jgi:diacylglycerol kinase (ATP)